MKYNYTTDYNHPHYYSGNIFTSNRYGRYRILGKLLNHNRRGYYVIQFEETGWICPYISRHLLSLNPLLARCRRYSRGER
ncbi:TPA_asm: hypothetical protein G1314_03640 [Salmonella enterica]|uniref:Uncharacterized protein n=1 Tax=Salmonella enterica TaxID=28901 RepID=A0A721Y6Y3_SALER|nr:hypothetical protein [Salmonella enterica]